MRQPKFDLYAALGVSKNIRPSEIKVAYLKLAKDFHPDKNLALSPLERNLRNEAMYGINEAYAILSNPVERIKYDLFSASIRLEKPSFYYLIRKVSVTKTIEDIASKITIKVNNAPKKKIEDVIDTLNEMTSISKLKEFLRIAHSLYEEEKYYKGINIDRRI